MTDPLPIRPLSRPIDATVTIPGSKSITNRALILAALSRGESRIEGALYSDDTRHLATALRGLGIGVDEDEPRGVFRVGGTGGRIPIDAAELFIGNSGTAARFLTAFCALGRGTFRIDGVERMRRRPIRDLVQALNQLGIDVRADTGCPPVVVQANRFRGGRCTLKGEASSQYLSALLMVAPLSEDGVEIEIKGELASKPYVDITLRMMKQWGAKAESQDYRRFVLPGGQSYQARAYAVEPDASSASYFFAAAAVSGGRVRVSGLGADALQGDIKFAGVLGQMGCRVSYDADGIEVTGPAVLNGVDVDMNGISDTVMTLAAIAPFASSPTTIRNVANIRLKETDRLAALANELKRIGVQVEERADGLKIYPAKDILPAIIETYDDHRMAMSFAITGLRAPGIQIKDPGCVAKTFPDFFERLERLYS